MAPRDHRSVNRCGRNHLACKFPINVTVPLVKHGTTINPPGEIRARLFLVQAWRWKPHFYLLSALSTAFAPSFAASFTLPMPTWASPLSS